MVDVRLDVRELRKMSDKDLLDAIEDKRESIFNLRFQQGFGQLEDENAIKRERRDIARILMVLRERALEAMGDARPVKRVRGVNKSHLVQKPKKGKELKKGDTLAK